MYCMRYKHASRGSDLEEREGQAPLGVCHQAHRGAALQNRLSRVSPRGLMLLRPFPSLPQLPASLPPVLTWPPRLPNQSTSNPDRRFPTGFLCPLRGKSGRPMRTGPHFLSESRLLATPATPARATKSTARKHCSSLGQADVVRASPHGHALRQANLMVALPHA